jgi:hypothetical protein
MTTALLSPALKNCQGHLQAPQEVSVGGSGYVHICQFLYIFS